MQKEFATELRSFIGRWLNDLAGHPGFQGLDSVTAFTAESYSLTARGGSRAPPSEIRTSAIEREKRASWATEERWAARGGWASATGLGREQVCSLFFSF